MLKTLTAGQLPEPRELEKRLSIALVKKMGILKQPYLIRPQDPKINPPAEHLLWAAVLLEDNEKFSLAADILYTEKLESGIICNQQELVSEQLDALLLVSENREILKKMNRIVKN